MKDPVGSTTLSSHGNTSGSTLVEKIWIHYLSIKTTINTVVTVQLFDNLYVSESSNGQNSVTLKAGDEAARRVW